MNTFTLSLIKSHLVTAQVIWNIRFLVYHVTQFISKEKIFISNNLSAVKTTVDRKPCVTMKVWTNNEFVEVSSTVNSKYTDCEICARVFF